jgi:GMP synthase (glutamine-hydrolysing)
MRALVVQHIAVEGPGILTPCLETRGWEIETVALYAEAQLPKNPGAYQAIIVMGGPMGVYDDAEYPFLRAEHDFLTQAIEQEVPLLGICLGSQLLAKALGARVYRNPYKEIGWDTVDLTVAGTADPVFTGVSSPVRVFQWHGDAFELPAEATRLASSVRCPNQAFRYRDRVYGLLFHLELTPDIIHSWIATFQDELAGVSDQVNPEQIVADIPRYLDHYQQTRVRVFANLLDRLWEPLAVQSGHGVMATR